MSFFKNIGDGLGKISKVTDKLNPMNIISKTGGAIGDKVLNSTV
jgi:hypothetical protein